MPRKPASNGERNQLLLGLRKALDLESFDRLRELANDGDMGAALRSMLYLEVEQAKTRVVDSRLDDGPEKLVILKARYEGAKLLADNLIEAIRLLKKID